MSKFPPAKISTTETTKNLGIANPSRYLREENQEDDSNPTQESERRVTEIVREIDYRNSNIGGVIGAFARNLWDKIFGAEKPLAAQNKTQRKLTQKPKTHQHVVAFIHNSYDELPMLQSDGKKLKQNIEKLDAEIAANPSYESYLKRSEYHHTLYLLSHGIGTGNFINHGNTARRYGDNIIKNKPHTPLESDKYLLQAVSDIQSAIEINPKDSAAFFQLGLIYLYSSLDKNEARKNFEKAIELSPTMPWAHHFLGISYFGKKEALKHFQAENLINPNRQSWERIGIIKLNHNRPKEALKAFQQAQSLDPEAEMINLHLGKTYLKQGQKDLALEYFEQEVKNSYPNRDRYSRHFAYQEIAKINLKDNPQKSLELFNKIIEESDYRERKHAVRYEDRASAYEALGLYTEAEKDFGKALSIRLEKHALKSSTYFKLANSYIKKYKSVQAAVENLNTPSFYPKIEESKEVLSKHSPLILYLLNIEKAFIYLEGARNSQLSDGERNDMREKAFDLLSQKYNTEENQYYGLSLQKFAEKIVMEEQRKINKKTTNPSTIIETPESRKLQTEQTHQKHRHNNLS